MQKFIYTILSLVLLPGCLLAQSPKSRSFELNYTVKLTGLAAQQTYRMWLPVPSKSDVQQVQAILPAVGNLYGEKKHGNNLFYIEGVADGKGEVCHDLKYVVTRKEVISEGDKPSLEQVQQYLQPDKLVPIGGKSLSLLAEKKIPADGMKAARIMYDAVNNHMKYSKDGTGWGRGDSDWACDSRYGNCTDFHSLFMSMARAHKIPVKFEIGLSIPVQRGEGEVTGYHCWAYFQPEPNAGWVPVDISEANKNPKMVDYYFGNLTEDRITFTTGRDLVLEPAQAGPPVNFLINPYVEVDGKPLTSEKIKRTVKYKDLKAK